MTRSHLAFASALLILFSLLPPATHAQGQATLLVRFRPAVTPAQRHRLLQPLAAQVVGQVPQLDLTCVAVPATRASTALNALKQDEAVAYAEPNARAGATLSPNDPDWTQQWGPQKVKAPLAWDITTGSPDVIVAVLDSGTALGHPDLAGQLWTNPGEVPGNGVDDDGNGQVDDVWGWHYYHEWTGHTFVPDENAQVADDYGHGTHVAGIVGAAIDNGVGIAGMAGGSRLMTVKVLDEFGIGWYFDIARGIVYAVDNGARIVNLSLGGSAPSEALQDAVDYAHAHDVLVVASAGNNGEGVFYPAACEHALAVAATDTNDQHPSFSNHGPEVDVAAPGVDIYSTWPWGSNYLVKSGTSAAAPHVSGLAALVWSHQPGLTSDQVAGRIQQTAVDLGESGWDEFAGWGRIDAYWAVLGPPPFRSYLPCALNRSSWWPTR